MPSHTVREIIRNISQRNLQSTPSVQGFFDQRNRQTIDAAKTALAARAAVSGLSVPELQAREGANAQREIDNQRREQQAEAASAASDLDLNRQRVATSRILANTAQTRANQGGNISSAGAAALGIDPSLAGQISKPTARQVADSKLVRERLANDKKRIANLEQKAKDVAKRETGKNELAQRKEARLRSKAERARIQASEEIATQQEKDDLADDAFEEALAGIKGNTATTADFDRVAAEAVEELGLPPEFFADKPENKNDRDRLKKLMVEKLEAEGIFVPKKAR